MVAQISDGKIALGGLFDSFKVQVNEYAEIINKFNNLDLSQRKYLVQTVKQIGKQLQKQSEQLMLEQLDILKPLITARERLTMPLHQQKVWQLI